MAPIDGRVGTSTRPRPMYEDSYMEPMNEEARDFQSVADILSSVEDTVNRIAITLRSMSDGLEGSRPVPTNGVERCDPPSPGLRERLAQVYEQVSKIDKHAVTLSRDIFGR